MAQTACDTHVSTGMRVFHRQFHFSAPELSRANVVKSKVQPTLARNAALQRFAGIKFQHALLCCPNNIGVPLIRYETPHSPLFEVSTDSFSDSDGTVGCL